MNCVNTKSKEFRDATHRLDVSEASLEPIIHEYQNFPATLDKFPSDDYIREKLGITASYEEASSLIRSVWESRYPKAMEFNSTTELSRAITEAQKFFPKEQIYSYQKSDGTYVMKVARPIERSNYNITSATDALRIISSEFNGIGGLHAVTTSTGKKYKVTSTVDTTVEGQRATDYRSTIEASSAFLEKLYTSRFSYLADSISIDKYGYVEINYTPQNDTIKLEDNLDIESRKANVIKIGKFLKEKFPQVNIIWCKNKEELSHIANEGRTGKRVTPNCFFKGGKVYFNLSAFNRGELSEAQVAEEFLHPLISAVYNTNPALFNSLLSEAKGGFQTLSHEIDTTYSEKLGFTENDRQQELVTQVLARYTRGELKNPTKSLKEALNSIWSVIKNFCKDLLKSKYGDSYVIKPEEIDSHFTFEDLSKIINTHDTYFDTTYADGKSKFSLDTQAELRPIEEIEREVSVMYMSKEDPRLSGNLASVSSDGTIKIANDFTMGEFWEYMEGTKQGASKQKAQVLKGVMEKYSNLRGIIDSVDKAKEVIYYREISHLQHNDHSVYPRTSEGKLDTMSPDAIAIETRATLDAIERVIEKLPMPAYERLGQFSRNSITFDPITHTYKINGIKADISVTEYRDRGKTRELEADPTVLGYLEVASELGTVHDEIARDFLSGNLKTSYPNMTKSDVDTFTKSLETFREELDNTYGKGNYTIITDEASLRVAGQIEIDGEAKVIAGTMDMLLIDGNGKYHIYDFKTKRTNTSTEYDTSTLDGCNEQLSLYQTIIEANYPELIGKFGGNHLVQINLKYETPQGSRANEYGTTTYRRIKGAQIGIYNGDVTIPIQNTESGYQAGVFNKTIAAKPKKVATIKELQKQSNQQPTMTQEQKTPTDAEKYLQEQAAFTKQVDNLLGSSIIQASEARHIAEQIIYWISDHITEMQEHPELIKEYYGVDINIDGKTRAGIVNAIGVDRVINKAKDKFQSTKFEKRSTTKKARLITSNWNALMKIASDTFANVEDFAIVSSEDGHNSIVTEINADADNFNDSNTSEEVAELEGDIQEHWQVESRTLDVLANASQLVRQALTKCYILEQVGVDENGQPKYDYKRSEFGINERINARDAVNSILRWTQGSVTFNDMVTKLQEKSKTEPWLIQITEKLLDTTGKYSDFQSQFFGICKPFQLYSIVIKEDGTYKSVTVNELPALREAVTSITTQFKIGEHPMFGVNGVNKEAFKSFKEVCEELKILRRKPFVDVDKAKSIENLTYASGLLGYYATRDMVEAALNETTMKSMVDALLYMQKSIEANLDNPNYDPFKFKGDGSIGGNLRRFLQPLTDKLEDIAVSSFYDNGKMYQSYVTPSYMTKLMQKFKLTGNEFDEFIQEEFGKYSWFKEQNGSIERGWKNEWLRRLVTDDAARRIFAHKVQLNFNKHNYMRNMSDTEYALSLFAEYFSESKNDKDPDRTPAWFRIPMLSNKPSSEFIRFYSYRGSNYKQSLVEGFKKIFDQELSRIQTVEMRSYDKSDPRFIKNFDKNGRKFMFLDFMNPYLSGDTKTVELTDANDTTETIDVHSLLRSKLDGRELSSEQEAKLNKAIKALIFRNMERRAKSILTEWKSQGIFDGAKQIENLGTEETEIAANLENFIWNDTFAAMNIMQMTVTDIAYYKDAEDLQKRLAQIHAPGIRANASARDYNGNLVSDGKMRTFYLKDFDGFRSNIIENISVVFDRKISQAKDQDKPALRALKESILKQFEDINVADAQGYSSPTSYRKKAFLFGKWSPKAEEIYQKLKSGNYTYNDLQVAFQPLKPFVYSQLTKDSGVNGAPMGPLKVPVQNKNSEYLLVMADAILQGEHTGRPNLLRAIYEVMEESAAKDNTKGIDTVQFESTVKSGLMGSIDIGQFQYSSDGEAKAKAMMKQAIYKDGAYDPTFVHEIPVEDYCIQQEVPEHFKGHSQAHGSQIRFIIPSDLETVDYAGNPVTYEVEGRKLTAEQFKTEYENTIAENINESITNLQEELGLNNLNNVIDRNIALSKILQREILSSPRYGIDLLQACSLDENGNFRIPLGDPIQSKRVEQLLNSIIKNRVNKQTIAGGPVVQVTNFGTSIELNIRFKDKSGKLLKTRKEFEGTDAEYKEYIKESQGGIAYFEVFAPIYSNELFTMFSDEKGNINMDAINMLEPDLLKMIGYRIPTEDKYSMAPLKIVGFLPREAGDGIMLPNDITLLTGSDFDVDKEYLMRKELRINRTKAKRRDIFERLWEFSIQKQPNLNYEGKIKLKEDINMFLDSPFRKGNSRELLRQYVEIAFEVDKPTEGRIYRNNKIVDMTYEVLTHESTADKMLNPGGFDSQKRMGYMVAAFRNSANKYTWDQLQKMSIDELKDACYIDKNLSYIDTHVQFYKQNAAAGALIGMFAVHKVAHAVLESNGYKMDVEEICGRNFSIAGMEFKDRMVLDNKYDVNGQLIGKTLGCLVASAVDAVKDPILNLMNINGGTANILNTLVRLGMPFDNAALFLSQKIIADVLAQYNSENVTGYKSLNEVISERLKKMNIEESSKLNSEELSYEELVQGIKENKPEIDYKVLKAFQDVQKLSAAIKGPTFATRFNSISSAVGPLVIDNLILEHKMTQFSDYIFDSQDNPVDLYTILDRHPILSGFAKTVGIAKELFGSMPANSQGFRNILDSIEGTPLSNILYGDRRLLSSLSDFYQSYLLIASGAVKEGNLQRYVSSFPIDFFKQNYKEKYPDNPLIQAIRLDVNKNTGRAVLKINTTGLDTQQKEILSSGWIDLHKADPELSTRLFMYNFFRCGIGFSPKTFMGLVPTYVKEQIKGYVDTFRVLPSVSPELVLNQFIRNNWDNPKLVPKKIGLKLVDKGEGLKAILEEGQIAEMKNVPFFRVRVNGSDVLYQQISSEEKQLLYKEITPLGNNKEYLEMSTSDITKPANIPAVAKEDLSTNQIQDRTDTEDSTVPRRTQQELIDIAYKAIEARYGTAEVQHQVDRLKSWKEAERAEIEAQVKEFFKGQFEKLGIRYDQKTIDEVYKLFC